MMQFFKANLLWTQGVSIFFVILALGVIGFIFFRPIFYIALGLFIFSVWFFRNPERMCPQAAGDASILVCPADGKVVDIQYSADQSLEGYAQKVSIFLSPLDVHVNWTPMAGIVKKVQYRLGTFKIAYLPKSSEFNERNDLHLQSTDGKTIIVRQIAGSVARRICCWVKEGQNVGFGQKYGMIRFGSRVDILLPRNVELSIGVGQRVYGGETVLGRWI
ncbi:phosphatidylserine decarboxylase family protein [bacterium]|nr:phosphatidylserine decarboxylase family protein [bacterium]